MVRAMFPKTFTVSVGAMAIAFLVGCEGDVPAMGSPGMEEDSITLSAPRKISADDSRPTPPPDGGANAGVMLAYSYSMGISAPKGAVAPMMDAHQQQCIDAGPTICQILGSSVNSWGDDHVSASLNLRAVPSWLETFRGAIASDADKAGGKLTSNTVRADDLTQYIVDMDARLEAKKALRDRIRVLLETNEGSLSDVLAAERALSDVQGEIDSMTAQLQAARARVAMSTLNISYQSDPETSTGIFKPLVQAFGDFGRTSVASLAEAVRFVARTWPFFIVLMIALAVLRSWWRGRRKA